MFEQSPVFSGFVAHYRPEAGVGELLQRWKVDGLVDIPEETWLPMRLTEKGQQIYDDLTAPTNAPCWP
jgi:hypothetical protein